MHHSKVSTNYPWLPHNIDPSIPTPDEYKDMLINPLGDRQSVYDQFIESCRTAYPGRKGDRCVSTEADRIEMTRRQPQSMQNYTEIGFKKVRAPEKLFSLIQKFWDANKDKARAEVWGVGNTYTNNWVVPSEMVSVEDTNLRGGGNSLKQKIWDAAKVVISEWTGQELTQCSLYGIRVYKGGSVLAPHVDRLPLVSSAIINVAQDVDEPWPLEVIGHNGKAANVTMEPGDMVLYESHSVIHGRPFPMKGRFMANIFVHFEPTGHSLRHNMKLDEEAGRDVNTKYREALARGVGGHESDNSDLPPYIKAGSPEEAHWRQTHPQGRQSQQRSFTTGSTPAHLAAKEGEVRTLHEEIKKKKDIVNAKDANGWTPLHEGARGGHLEVVKLLVENGADVSARTGEDGGTPLWWAKQTHGEDSEVVKFLEEIGALDIGPEL
jgi:prolyl 4-hydroxylase